MQRHNRVFISKLKISKHVYSNHPDGLMNCTFCIVFVVVFLTFFDLSVPVLFLRIKIYNNNNNIIINLITMGNKDSS